VVSLLREKLRVEVPIRSVFAFPTVEELAGGLGVVGGVGGSVVCPVVRGGVLPLSFGQQRLWFLDQLLGGGAEYLIPVGLRLCGVLDVSALRGALAGLVARHEVLRTVFDVVDGQPVQVVTDAGVELEVREWVGGVESVGEVLRREACRPMDLRRGPLVRALLVRLAVDEHVLLLTWHHIVADGWSFGVLIRELRELYAAGVAGRPCELAGLPVQYADFAVWQRQWLQGEVLAGQLGYWREQLRGLTPVELPTDRPRPAVRTGRGATVEFGVAGPVVAGLRRVAVQCQASLFMVVLAVFAVWLGYYSGQTDVAVGTPVAGRNRREIEDLVGFFVNTLVMRVDLAGDPGFGQLLERVKQVAFGAYEHQDLPFERLVEELAPQRDLSRTPLFQTMLVLQNTGDRRWQLPGLRVEPLPVGTDTARFDLTVVLVEQEQGLAGRVNYSVDLFDEVTVARMAGHLQALLAAVVAAPQARVSQLPMLTEAEHRQLLDWGRGPVVAVSEQRCVHEVIAEQATLHPDRVAVVSDAGQLTYQQLDTRANQLAHRLRVAGVGPEVVVAILLPRSPQLIVALLAVLKAGGGYLPLDPDHPTGRLAFMLTDTAAALVITDQTHRDRLPDTTTIIDLDTEQSTLASYPTTTPTPTTTGDNLAYTIYTSGSTGTPKGTQITHQSLTNLLAGMHGVFPLSGDSAVLSLTAAVFDIFNVEVFLPLLAGALLVVASKEQIHSPEAVAQLIDEHRIELAQTTPSAWRVIVSAIRQRHPRLQIFTAGEALPADLADQMRNVAGRTVNGYGPTEATIYTTVADLTRQDAGVTIGGPVANVEVFVVDGCGRLVPVGVPGELLIGGVGLARGYVNRPGLTAERFVPHPFGGRGSRVYRTGDVVRWSSDGVLEFLGRSDDQVKVRGFRIELGEVESVLVGHPGVASAVVMVREDGGDRRLVAYCVRVSGVEVDVSGLREWCGRSLPGFMVPGWFVFLDALPLTLNGKVDRAALPVPVGQRPDVRARFVAPRSAVEAVIAQVWQQVLGVARVGVFDNFFDLGGDSILSIQVIARVKRFGLHWSPRMVFQYQTVAELAAHGQGGVVVAAAQGPVLGPVTLTPIQHWFFGLGLADVQHFNQAMLLHTDGLDGPLLEQALGVLAGHHDALRLRFTLQGDRWRQDLGEQAGPDLVTVHDLTGLDDAAVWPAVAEVAEAVQASLRIDRGPLLRAALLDLGGTRGQRLLLVVHHLAIDGVSWRILLEDLGTIYHSLATGHDPLLPAKTTSVQDWAAALCRYAGTDQARQELAFWTQPHPVWPLPRDRHGDNTLAQAATTTITLDAGHTTALLREAPRAFGTTINDVLLTGLALAIHDWTAATTIAVNLEGHGREDLFPDVDLSRTIGWFTSIYPVHLQLLDPTNPITTLTSIHQQLATIPNKGIGYGILRYLDQPATQHLLANQPTPEISFNYLGQFDQHLPGLGHHADPAEPKGHPTNPTNPRPHLLDITASTRNNQLTIRITYTPNIHHHTTITNLTQHLTKTLHHISHTAQTTNTTNSRPVRALSTGPEPVQGRVQLVDLNRSEAARTMFCLHEIAGNVTGYTRLAELLQPRLRLVGVEAPSVSFGTEPYDDLAAMATSYWQAIERVQPTGPYLLAGWSLGAVLAVEVCRQIEESGQQVELLVAFDASLPTDDSEAAALDRVAAIDILLDEIRAAELAPGQPFVPSASSRDRMRSLNLPDGMLAMDHTDLSRQLRVIRAHWCAMAAYRPGSIGCDVLLFEAAGSTRPCPLEDNWAPAVNGKLNTRIVPGDHVTLLRPPAVDLVADALAQRIAGAVRSSE
jgi:amino acid adenylation domain-containing protein/non-ribosomal peptide synthase protein (TIGR01720 family)